MAIMALHSAATGLQALSTQLDVISNNIANANNDGFKGSRVNFEDLMYEYQQQPGARDENNNTRPTGHRGRTGNPRERDAVGYDPGVADADRARSGRVH